MRSLVFQSTELQGNDVITFITYTLALLTLIEESRSDSRQVKIILSAPKCPHQLEGQSTSY
jgi:hypothetical protein